MDSALPRLIALPARWVTHVWQVALRDRVGAVGLVLVDHVVHVGAHEMLGVLVDVFLVPCFTKDACPTGRAAADATAQDELDGGEDDHREAQPLTAWPPIQA